MVRLLAMSALSVLATLAIQAFAAADTVTLKSGQIHEGVITAEEEERVQLKLEGSGVRLWFSRDQILALERTEPKEEPVSDDDPPESAEDTTGLDEDAVRARELLKKMREESEDKAKTKNKNRVTAGPADTQLDTPDGPSQTEVEKLIETMRDADLYGRLSACKKLGELKAEEAVPHLIQLLDDDKHILREAANESLIKITEQDFGFNSKDPRSLRLEAIEKWEQWHKDEQRKEAGLQLRSFW